MIFRYVLFINYQVMINLNFNLNLLPAILTAILITQTASYNKFCSVICTNQACSSNATNACTACASPWTWNTTTNVCELLPTTGFVQVDRSSDMSGGGINPDFMMMATCSGPGWAYTYFGNLTGNDVITFSDANGVQVPHYQIRVVFWMILIDQWVNENTVTVKLNGGQPQTIRRSNRLSVEQVCGNNGNWQDYIRFDRTYTHNDSTPYDISITTNNTGSKWGIKQFIVLARTCHAACLSCFGAPASQCYSCQQDTPMLLSGTTCNQSCMPGYGMMFDGMNCVFCDLRCTVCFQEKYNCTVCKSSGTYASFLLASNFSCERTCPVGMYGNYTDRVCYPCLPACVSCRTLPDFCYECNTTLGYAWNNYKCYNPCPIGTFLTANITNCSNCSPLCISCMNTSTTCQACTLTGIYKAYLLGSSCLLDCGNDYYEDTANGTLNTCQPCLPACKVCTANPSPCQACNAGYWYFEQTCGSSCPSDYFKDNVTWTCLLCQIWCVKLQMDMYFPDASNGQIYVDMSFSQDLDFSTFPYQSFQSFSIDSDLYTLEMFNYTYKILSPRSYRIIMQPKGYIFLYNATINCQTIPYPGIPHYSFNGRPFNLNNYEVPRSLVWFVIKAPDMTEIQKSITNILSNFSNQINDFTTKPFVQQIKKTGIFGLLMSGAQITSCSMLVNNIPSQNLYQGARFWGSFVFFDVPKWEKNSDKTKYAVLPAVSDVVKDARLLEQGEEQHARRMLFDVNQIQWRFLRTGHTSFFIFDTYGVIFLVIFCWLLLIIGYCANKHKPLLFKRHVGKFYSFVHKVHQISIMYITLNALLQWLYFNPSSLERWLSFGFSILVNIYFLIYELYIYYDMIKYPTAIIGNQKYEYYAIRYGSFLKSIRFEQYNLKQAWSPKQWFRPYNYHILSYYKKLLMIASLPLFYHTTHAQASILLLLQLAEIVRFCCIWPFYQKWKNIYRLVLQGALAMLFICVLIQGFIVQEIMRNDENTIMYSIQMFYRFGWVGFGMVFFFNLGFLVLAGYDLYRGCRMTNRQMMDQARRIFYYDKLKAFEEENQDVPLGLVNKWVRLGNLNNRDYDELPDVNIRVEYIRISQVSKKQYQIQLKKLLQLYMNIEFNFAKDNNVNCGLKCNRKFSLTQKLSKPFFYLIDDLYHKYAEFGADEFIIKTFQKVEQSLYRPGQKIQLSRHRMTQRIILEFHSGYKKTIQLDKLIQGLPLAKELLEYIPKTELEGMRD